MTTATAMTNAVVVRMEKAAVIRAIHEDAAFSEFVVTYVLKVPPPYRRSDRPVLQLERAAARSPFAAAGQLRKGGPHRVRDSQDRSGNTSQMIGSTRSRVNFFMNKFRSSA